MAAALCFWNPLEFWNMTQKTKHGYFTICSMENLPGIPTCIRDTEASRVMSNLSGTPKESIFAVPRWREGFSFFPLIFLIFELESNYHSYVSQSLDLKVWGSLLKGKFTPRKKISYLNHHVGNTKGDVFFFFLESLKTKFSYGSRRPERITWFNSSLEVFIQQLVWFLKSDWSSSV